MSEKTKDVLISGRRYTISKMTPETGCLIHSLLVNVATQFAMSQQSVTTESQPSAQPTNLQEKAEGTVKFLWLMSPAHLSEAQYRMVQKHALAVCGYYISPEVPVPNPVRMADGVRWADNALEDDPAGVMELITQALQFCIAPFFASGLEAPPATTK